MAFAALLGFRAEVLLPHIRRVLAFTAMRSDARAYATDNGRIDRRARDNDLAFGKGWQVIKQVSTDTLDGRRYALLVDLVDNTHDTLGLALAQHVGIQFAGSLTD